MTAASGPVGGPRRALARWAVIRPATIGLALTSVALTPLAPIRPVLAWLTAIRVPPAWAYVTRVVVGVWIALYLAYFVQLDSPYWAATTVSLVAHPVRGAVFSKCLWRVLGTIVGAAAMVALAAAFPQQPVLFMAGAAVWLGLFTFIASLLRYFRAYGAVLAGFTVCLVGFGAVEHPQTIFDLALARVAAVTIGVLSATVVSLVFHGSVGETELEARLAAQLAAVARLLRRQLHGQASPSPYGEQARISLALAGMDEIIEFASVESFDIQRRATSLRTGVAELVGALIGGSHTMRMMQRATRPGQDDQAAGDQIAAEDHGVAKDHGAARDHGAANQGAAEDQGAASQGGAERKTDDQGADERSTDRPATDHPATDHPATDHPATDHPAADDRGAAVMDAALAQCERLAQSPDANTRSALLSATRTARDQLAAIMRERTPRTDVMALAQAQDLLDRLSRAVRSIAAGRDDLQPESLRLRTYLDWRTAIRNGMRAMIALGLGSAFWIVTAWPTGGSMLAMLGVICGLLATNPSAAAVSVDFAKGVVLAVLCAFVCAFGLLTHVTGFPLLALCLLPFVAGSAYASTKPHLTPVVIPLLIFFLPMVGATNPMRYDLVAFFNTAFAYVCGSIWAVSAFRIVLPSNMALNVRRLCRSIERDVERLGRPRPVPNRLQWEHLQHQKLVRLIGRMSRASVARREGVIEQAYAAIAVGSAAIQLRTALAAGTLAAPVQAVAERALGLLRDLRSSPAAAATRSTELAHVLAARDSGEAAPGVPPGVPGSGELVHLAGAFAQIGALIQQHQDFFRQPGAAFGEEVPC